MREIKEGTRLKVKSLSYEKFEDLDYEYDGPGWNEDMQEFAGKMLTVDFVRTDGCILVLEDDGEWTWAEFMFEDVYVPSLNEENYII